LPSLENGMARNASSNLNKGFPDLSRNPILAWFAEEKHLMFYFGPILQRHCQQQLCPLKREGKYKLIGCSKIKCFKQWRHVKLKGTMTKFPVQKDNNTHTQSSTKYADHQDATDIQKKDFFLFFGFFFIFYL